MNKAETIQVITLLAGNYDSIVKKDNTQKQLMIDTWQACLGDLDYKLVLQAVKKTIIESPYPPTIHDIRKNAVNITKPTTNDVLTEWNECYKMICSGTYMTQEEFEQHSDICKKFIGSLSQLRNYAVSDIEVLNTVVKGQFMKQYEVLKQREFTNNLLPINMLTRENIKQIGE